MYFDADTIKLGDIDVSALAEKVAAVSDAAWAADEHRQQRYDVHTQTETIKLLFDQDDRHRNPTVRPAFESFRDLVDPIGQAVEQYYASALDRKFASPERPPGYFIRIIFTRMLPGTQINPHRDGGYSLKRCHRVHIPVMTNECCAFRVGETNFHMGAGEMWEINNRLIHAVKNDGDSARVHLIMDYVQPGEQVDDPLGPVVA